MSTDKFSISSSAVQVSQSEPDCDSSSTISADVVGDLDDAPVVQRPMRPIVRPEQMTCPDRERLRPDS